MALEKAYGDQSPFDMQEGFARLTRSPVFHETSLDAVLSELAESAARLANVERTSIWAADGRLGELHCWERFELASRRHSGGELILRARYPGYFAALDKGEAIVADDAYNHPATLEFIDSYLPHHRVTALLDTPIYVRGELQGILRFEQVGLRHPWTSVHRLFAHAMSNLVALALVEGEAAEVRQRMQQAADRLQAVFAASRDAMLLVDCESGLLLDVNRRAEALFGYRSAAMIGKPRLLFLPEENLVERRDCLRCVPAECDRCAAVSGFARTGDGVDLPVEMTTEVADLEGGRRWALIIVRQPD